LVFIWSPTRRALLFREKEAKSLFIAWLVLILRKISSISDEILGFEISSLPLRTSTTVRAMLSKLRKSLF
jgi:hypothetical protein